MLFQMFFLAIISVLIGGLLCLAVATDPNRIPSRSRQRLLPIGLAMMFAGLGFVGFTFTLDYLGHSFESYFGTLPLVGVAVFLAGYGVIIVGGVALGFTIGVRRNRKLHY